MPLCLHCHKCVNKAHNDSHEGAKRKSQCSDLRPQCSRWQVVLKPRQSASTHGNLTRRSCDWTLSWWADGRWFYSVCSGLVSSQAVDGTKANIDTRQRVRMYFSFYTWIPSWNCPHFISCERHKAGCVGKAKAKAECSFSTEWSEDTWQMHECDPVIFNYKDQWAFNWLRGRFLDPVCRSVVLGLWYGANRKCTYWRTNWASVSDRNTATALILSP